MHDLSSPQVIICVGKAGYITQITQTKANNLYCFFTFYDFVANIICPQNCYTFTFNLGFKIKTLKPLYTYHKLFLRKKKQFAIVKSPI